MKIKFQIKLLTLVMILWVTPVHAFAASINFYPTSVSVPQSTSYTVTLLLDTLDKSLNAIDGTILVAKEMGDNITVTDSGSVVTYWVQRPEWDSKTRSIKFSGTVPGGYSGNNGILLSLVLPSYNGSKINNALTVTDLRGYANDGFGTPIAIASNQFALGQTNASEDASITDQLFIDNKKQDGLPPEAFTAQVSRDNLVYDGKWFISFATIDKQSGIDRYELQESSSGRIDSAKWKVVTSPYVLEDQSLRSFIYITAIDRQGNERVIKVFPKNETSWIFRYSYDFAVIGGILLVVIVGYIYFRRKNSSSVISNTITEIK